MDISVDEFRVLVLKPRGDRNYIGIVAVHDDVMSLVDHYEVVTAIDDGQVLELRHAAGAKFQTDKLDVLKS